MYENLPIFKKALELNVYVDQSVQNFSRYNKYAIGAELREKSRKILYGIYKNYFSKDKVASLLELRDSIEELKITIYLANELKVFRDFKQVELLSKMARELAKQAQGWLNSQNHTSNKGL